jgi:hypothetical protein
VAELVDAPDLGSGAARRGGSSPSRRTVGQTTERIHHGFEESRIDRSLQRGSDDVG